MPTLAASTSPQSRYLSVAVQAGQRLPAEATSLGRILLAHRPAADDDASATIRDDGYVITDGLLESGLRSLGVPVRDHGGEVIAAMSMAASASRIGLDDLRQRCLPTMLQAAEILTQRL